MPKTNRFGISYPTRSRKLFSARNFIGSNRNNAGKFSKSLRRTCLEQKGRGHYPPRFARHLELYGFLRDLLGHVGATTQSDRRRNRDAVARKLLGTAGSRCRVSPHPA